jgi:hypothetical protein
MEAAKGKILKLWKTFAALKTAGAATKIGQAWRRSRRTRRGRLRPEAKEFRAVSNLRAEAEEFQAGSYRWRRRNGQGRQPFKYFNLPMTQWGPPVVINPLARPKAQRRVNPPGYKRVAGAMLQQRQMEIAAERRRGLSAKKQKCKRQLNLEFRKVRGDPTGRHAAMKRMQEEGDVDGMKRLKSRTMKDLRGLMAAARHERGRIKNAAHEGRLDALQKLLEDNGLIGEQAKDISKYCLLYIDPLLLREAKNCNGDFKAISNSKLGKLRHGLAGTWEGLRNDEDAAAVELWKPMLQLFPNLEGVEESEYLKYCSDSESEYSDSDSDCSGSSCGSVGRMKDQQLYGWWR